MDVNEYLEFRASPGITDVTQAASVPAQFKTAPAQGSVPQTSQFNTDQVMDALATFTGIRFDSVGDFLGYYQGNYFQTAYTQLKPFTCHQLAIGNPYITSAIDSIADPISTTKFIAEPKIVNDKLNPTEAMWIEYLLNNPNPLQPANVFYKHILVDELQTGSAYIEVSYNEYGLPGRFDRIPPYMIEPKKFQGHTFYRRLDNGYIFPDNALITIFNPNPYSDARGLSRLVPLFINMLTDTALMEHNLRYFVKDTLKGIISVSDNISTDNYAKELQMIKTQIQEMETKADSGHLIMHGANFQSLSNSNRDMMTPDIWEANINAICAVYHVPPHKVMKVKEGNLGGNAGESQDDTMNQTIDNHAEKILGYLNFKLLDWMGIQNTVIAYSGDLTKTDELRQAQLDTEKLANGTTVLNEVRKKYGDDPYPNKLADEPFLSVRTLPLSMAGLPFIARASAAGGGDLAGLHPGEDPIGGELKVLANPDEDQEAVSKQERLEQRGMTFEEKLEQMGNVKRYLRKRGYVRTL
jgi:HK97 family phage portal protein